MNKQSGFTLIELVVVVILLTILAIASFQFITFGTQIYVTGQERQQTLSDSRFIIERMSREIRSAIPNSVRIQSSGTTACIEFAPIKVSGAYREDANAAVVPPIAPNPELNQIDVISWANASDYDQGDRLYIYPTAAAGGDIYDNNNNVDQFAIINRVDPDPVNEEQILITFSAADQFVNGSNINRFYTADHSVQFCLIETAVNSGIFNVYRYENTSFNPNMQFPTAASGVLMAEGLTNSTSDISQSRYPFKYREGALVSNSVVNLYLEFSTDSQENMFFNQEVHIPNVP